MNKTNKRPKQISSHMNYRLDFYINIISSELPIHSRWSRLPCLPHPSPGAAIFLVSCICESCPSARKHHHFRHRRTPPPTSACSTEYPLLFLVLRKCVKWAATRGLRRRQGSPEVEPPETGKRPAAEEKQVGRRQNRNDMHKKDPHVLSQSFVPPRDSCTHSPLFLGSGTLHSLSLSLSFPPATVLSPSLLHPPSLSKP